MGNAQRLKAYAWQCNVLKRLALRIRLLETFVFNAIYWMVKTLGEPAKHVL